MQDEFRRAVPAAGIPIRHNAVFLGDGSLHVPSCVMVGAAGHTGQQALSTLYRKSESTANVAAGYHRVVLYKVMWLTIKSGRHARNEKRLLP